MAKKKVTSKEEGKRLDLILTFAYPNLSRTNIRKLLDAGRGKVNGDIEYRPNYKVKEGDQLELDVERELERKSLEPYEIDVDIIYRDDHIVIPNKPSGLRVHPHSATDQKTLLNALYWLLSSDIGEYGVNLVNRIDKATSGLVVAAISPQGAWHYSKQFATGAVKKQYLAIVYGDWKGRHGTAKVQESNFLAYDGIHKRQKVDSEKGDFAETYFTLIKYDKKKNYSLLLAEPTTGRTHQIRIQLAHMGFPIVGDTKYEGMAASRLMLHAYGLRMPKYSDGDNDEEEIDIKAPVPLEFPVLP